MLTVLPKAGWMVLWCVLLAVLPGCELAPERVAGAGDDAPELVAPASGSRHWLGPAYWGNRLQDWRFEDGRLVCVTPQGWLPMRTVHDLTRQVTDRDAGFEASVTVSLAPAGAGGAYPDDAAAGMLVGVGHGRMDYRSAAIVHQWQAVGGGLFVGVDARGQAFIVDNERPWALGQQFDDAQALPRENWVASADSAEPDGKPANAIDGNPATIWHTEYRDNRPAHPHALVIDLGEAQTFAAFAYLPRQDSDSGRVGGFDFFATNDPENWGESLASGTLPNGSEMQVIALPETTARYVKLVAKSAQRPQPVTSVAEVYLLKEVIELGDEPDGELPERVRLVLKGGPTDDGRYALRVEAVDEADNAVISSAALTVERHRVLGNAALVSHPGTQARGAAPALFAFEGWSVAGDAVGYAPDQQLGPIVGSQYTLSRGVMKLTAQFLPLGDNDSPTATLQVLRDGVWRDLATANVSSPDYIASFRIPDWDDTRDTPFRVGYQLGGAGNDGFYTWAGTIRKDPVDKDKIVVAGFTGSLQAPWGARRNWIDEMFFPHGDLTSRVAQQEPDLLFFSGDQIYEGTPTFADRQNIMLDYHYKWAMHIWAYRELMREIPTVTIPDDHDVYQGNYWGEGGRQAPGADNTGGYVHPAEFVSMVHRTHTSHLPDRPDPAPILRDIPVYHTDLVWGRVSFAVLADRMFKSGCADHGLPPSGTGRPDHYNNAAFDTDELDLPGLVLLGNRQLTFLDNWARDWRGADMKLAMSQTIFANMATHHGGGLSYLMADLDSNGWPQTGRRKAVEALRRGFAMHLAGDQHLATLVHHGVDEHKDAMWSFCVPSVANAYPRAWAPEAKGRYVYPQPEQFLGDRVDGFKNKVTVYAASNPGRDMGHEPAILHDRMPGYGIVVLDKANRTYEAQCWPRWADPADPSQQYAGWPRTIDQLDNYGRTPAGYLPTMTVNGLDNFVIEITRADTGELVYALRTKTNSFRPMVFDDTAYHVTVSEPDQDLSWSFEGMTIGGGAVEIDAR